MTGPHRPDDGQPARWSTPAFPGSIEGEVIATADAASPQPASRVAETGYTVPSYPAAAPYAGYSRPPAARSTNPLAITSMVLSIVSLPALACYGGGGLLGLVGAILGHVARHQVRRTGDDGAGMALAGIIVGWIAFALGIALAGLVVFAVLEIARGPMSN